MIRPASPASPASPAKSANPATPPRPTSAAGAGGPARPDETAAIGQLRAHVLSILAERGPQTASEIPRRWPVTRQHVRAMVRRLLKEGVVEPAPEGCGRPGAVRLIASPEGVPVRRAVQRPERQAVRRAVRPPLAQPGSER